MPLPENPHAALARPTSAMFCCGEPQCLYSVLEPWEDELPGFSQSYQQHPWPKCPEGHRAKLLSIAA